MGYRSSQFWVSWLTALHCILALRLGDTQSLASGKLRNFTHGFPGARNVLRSKKKLLGTETYDHTSFHTMVLTIQVRLWHHVTSFTTPSQVFSMAHVHESVIIFSDTASHFKTGQGEARERFVCEDLPWRKFRMCADSQGLFVGFLGNKSIHIKQRSLNQPCSAHVLAVICPRNVTPMDVKKWPSGGPLVWTVSRILTIAVKQTQASMQYVQWKQSITRINRI